MIEPFRSGAALQREIEETPSDALDRLYVWWLGQSGYLLKVAGSLLVIDPYLSEHLTQKYEATAKPHVRMTRAPLRGDELERVDVILSSHKHSDHMDPGTLPDLMSASSRAKFLYPAALADHVAALGLPVDRREGVAAGSIHSVGPFTIKPIPSAHEGLDTDAFGRHLYLGFVIEAGPFRIYHSGDSLSYPGLIDELGLSAFDVMFLPVNGRDPGRGVAGNMSAAEAVDLANAIRPRYLVPHHYDMFTFNTIPIEAFEREAARLAEPVEAKLLRCGERWEVRA